MNIYFNKSWFSSRVRRYNLRMIKPISENDKSYFFKLSQAKELSDLLGEGFIIAAQYDWKYNGFEFNDNLSIVQVEMLDQLERIKILNIPISQVLQISEDNAWISGWEFADEPTLGYVWMDVPDPYGTAYDRLVETDIHSYITETLTSHSFIGIANKYYSQQLVKDQQLKEVA